MISTMWTIIEANTGIICACLPMLKVPLTLIFPRIFARTSSNDVENTLSGPTVTNSNRNTNATTTGNWAKSKQAPMHLSLMKGGRAQTTRESQERMVGTESKEVPMGMINKRTDVDVRFDENESVSSSTRVSSKEHVTMPPHGRAHGISRA